MKQILITLCLLFSLQSFAQLKQADLADYLPLYIGQKLYTKKAGGRWAASTISLTNLASLAARCKGTLYECKIKLRSTTSMSEAEQTELQALCPQVGGITEVNEETGQVKYIVPSSSFVWTKGVDWCRRKGFDIDGLGAAGLTY